MGKWWDMVNNEGAYAPQKQPAQPQEGGKWWKMVNGEYPDYTQAQTAPQPKEQGWLDWGKEMVMGKQDPRFADTSTVYEQFTDDLRSPTATAAMMGASDPQMADIIQKQLGDRFIRREKDANGYDIFVTRGPDGQEQRGYINKPGLDGQDAWRFFYGAAPFAVTGGLVGGATRSLPFAAQVGAQGAGAAATSVGGDFAQQPMGSEQGVEIAKAGFAGAGGMLGPVAGRMLDKFGAGRAAKGMIDPNTGQLSDEGAKAAAKAGIDPQTLSPDAAKIFAETYAMTGDAAEAAVRAHVKPMGIPVTRGQMTKRPDLLTTEEAMRRNIYGDQARETMTAFDQQQASAIQDAAYGKVGGTIAPGRQPRENPFDTTPHILGKGVREGLDAAEGTMKQWERQAWGEVPRMTASKEALDNLPESLQRSIGDVIVDDNTPVALKMDEALASFIKGEAPQGGTKVLKNAAIQDVDRMRRRLLDISRSAATPEDSRAASKIYDGFNTWIDESAAKSLLAGSPDIAAKLKVARGFTKQIRQLLNPTDDTGRMTPGARKIAKVMDGRRVDSPERLIEELLPSGAGNNIPAGTVQSLGNIKKVLTVYGGDAGKAAWDDIRLAYWARIMSKPNGQMYEADSLVNRISTSFKQQKSVMQTLYSPQEQSLILRMQRALEQAAYKPPNASGSSYGMAHFAKQFAGKIADAFGLSGTWARTALEYSGIANKHGTALAKQAVRQSPPKMRREMPLPYAPRLPVGSAAGSQYGRNRER